MKENNFDPIKTIDHITNWTKDYFISNGPDAKAVIGISGGKDSTVAAMLLVRALGPERVVGVLMPQNTQNDIDDSREICKILGIQSYEIDIGPACSALYTSIDEAFGYGPDIKGSACAFNSGVTTNTPARMRMATLYAVAALTHGRVVNTCNWSEDFVGYSTKYGDAAGDFALLTKFAVREVISMGCVLAKEFNIPIKYIIKTPSDGMCGKSDEDNLGFTYEVLDAMLLDDEVPDYETYRNIMTRNDRNKHKECLKLPAPQSLLYRRHDNWGRSKSEGSFLF